MQVLLLQSHVLLVDANDAFDRINRQAALHNINIICPSFSTILHNTYGMPIRLFITGEGELSSTEGTTLGDPLAMAMYALAVTPLIQSSSARHITSLVCWWCCCCWQAAITFWVVEANITSWTLLWIANTCVIVKPELLDSAREIFDGSGIQVTILALPLDHVDF